MGLLRGNLVQGPIYRAAVAVAEGMQTRCGDVASELVTKPLLETLLKCLDCTGRVENYFSSFSLIFSPLSVNTICSNPLSDVSIT